MNKFTLSVVMLYASLCPLNMHAQEAARQTMPIEEMFSLADQNSRPSRPYAAGINRVHEGVRITKNARLPEIEASLSFSYLGDTSLAGRNFSNRSDVPVPHHGNNFAIEATQVAYVRGAITNSIAIARLQEEMIRLDLDTSCDKVRFLLIGYYLDLFKQQNMLQIYEKNIEQAKRATEELRVKEAGGVALKNDITQYKLLLASLESTRTQIGNTISILNNSLITSLGLPENIGIWPDTTILSRALPVRAKANWTTAIYANSPVLKQTSLAVQTSRHQQRTTRSKRIPKVALLVGNKLDGPTTIEILPISRNLSYWHVGVGLKYSFSSLSEANKTVARNRFVIWRNTERCEDAKEQTELAVNTGQVKYPGAYMELNTQWKGVELASLNYPVVRDCCKNDMTLIVNMPDASNPKLAIEVRLVDTQINIVFSYYKLLYISGTI